MSPSAKPKPRTIIGLHGKKGAGKTTIAFALAEMLGANAAVVSFAAPLKQLCGAIDSWYHARIPFTPIEKWLNIYLEGDELNTVRQQIAILSDMPELFVPENGKLRKLLQYVGTEIFRQISEDFWIEIFDYDIATYPPDVIVIVDDVRFPNEAKVCTKVYRVTGGAQDDSHASEIQDIECFATLENKHRMETPARLASIIFEQL